MTITKGFFIISGIYLMIFYTFEGFDVELSMSVFALSNNL
jgi:hypothetical protein